jgi:transcriptional regulator with XRE-family HTH domain
MTAEELIAARESIGQTQASLASALGLSANHYRKFEKGKCEVSQTVSLLMRDADSNGMPLIVQTFPDWVQRTIRALRKKSDLQSQEALSENSDQDQPNEGEGTPQQRRETMKDASE